MYSELLLFPNFHALRSVSTSAPNFCNSRTRIWELEIYGDGGGEAAGMGRSVGGDKGCTGERHRPPDVGHAAVLESRRRRRLDALGGVGGAPRLSYLLVEQPSNRVETSREGAHNPYRPPYARSCTSLH